MRVRSAFNVNWRFEEAPQDVDKCCLLTKDKRFIEGKPRKSVYKKDYIAWCEYPKIDKQEFERVKREYQGK